MLAKPPEVEFQETISKFRRRNKRSLLLVYVLLKIWHFHVAVMQKRQRNVMHLRSCCFVQNPFLKRKMVNFKLVEEMRNDLFHLPRAWDKDESESPTGFELMTLKFTIVLYHTHDDFDIADRRSM